MSRIVLRVGAAFMLLSVAACRDEGPAERVGRDVDEAVDDVRHAGEGPLEKAGRKADEALEAAKEKAEEAVEAAKEAVD